MNKTILSGASLLGFVALSLISAILILLASLTSVYMTWASAAYFAMVIGLVLRKQRQRHIQLMNLAIVLDLALVLLLEFQRSAIATAADFSLSIAQQAHIGFSSLAVALYIPVLYLGWGLYLGKLSTDRHRRWHKRLGILAFIARTLGFLLMFSLLEHVKKS